MFLGFRKLLITCLQAMNPKKNPVYDCRGLKHKFRIEPNCSDEVTNGSIQSHRNLKIPGSSRSTYITRLVH